MVIKLYHLYAQFPRNVRLSYRRIAIFRCIVTFSIIAPYKYSDLLIY